MRNIARLCNIASKFSQEKEVIFAILRYQCKLSSAIQKGTAA